MVELLDEGDEVASSLNSSTSNKIIAALGLYQNVCNEIAKLRDYQWQIAYYFLSFNGGLIALFLTDKFINQVRGFGKCLFSLAILISGALFTFYMVKYHNDLWTQRDIRRRIERILQFHDPKAYGGESLLPVAWSSPVGRWFQFNAIVIPLVFAVVMSHLVSLWLLWALGR